MSEHQDNVPGPEDSTEEAISPAPSPGSSSDPLIGTKIGSCTLKRIIGSGGMGTVYEAMQEQPRRRVALKMMKRGITSRSATRRFEFESQTLARLKHTGVAQIYEAGTHDDGSGGTPYFVMEYISNAKSITDYANGKKLGTRDRLKIFSKVCDAVQHGHLKGIVHRDLKPGNILVDTTGQPKIIDFGVARSTDSDMAVTTLQTDVGQLIGTLQYMSPEQCDADPSDIDIRSDVYALGIILYELLAGRPPYDLRQLAIHEAVRIIREEEPAKLSTIEKRLRGDVETIAMKALEKDRSRRYQSATALEQDILNYLSDKPISARPPSTADHLVRLIKKYKVAVLCVSVIILICNVVGLSYLAHQSRQSELISNFAREAAVSARAEAVEARVEADKSRRDAEKMLVRAMVGELKSILAINMLEDGWANFLDTFGSVLSHQPLDSDDSELSPYSSGISPLNLIPNSLTSQEAILAIPLHRGISNALRTDVTYAYAAEMGGLDVRIEGEVLDEYLNQVHRNYPGVSHIVFDIDAEGGEYPGTTVLLESILKHREHFTFTAYVQNATESIAIVPYACNEIVMQSDGEIGCNIYGGGVDVQKALNDSSSLFSHFFNAALDDVERFSLHPSARPLVISFLTGTDLYFNSEKGTFSLDEIDSPDWEQLYPEEARGTRTISADKAAYIGLARGVVNNIEEAANLVQEDVPVYDASFELHLLFAKYSWTPFGRLDLLIEDMGSALSLLAMDDDWKRFTSKVMPDGKVRSVIDGDHPIRQIQQFISGLRYEMAKNNNLKHSVKITSVYMALNKFLENGGEDYIENRGNMRNTTESEITDLARKAINQIAKSLEVDSEKPRILNPPVFTD